MGQAWQGRRNIWAKPQAATVRFIADTNSFSSTAGTSSEYVKNTCRRHGSLHRQNRNGRSVISAFRQGSGGKNGYQARGQAVRNNLFRVSIAGRPRVLLRVGMY